MRFEQGGPLSVTEDAPSPQGALIVPQLTVADELGIPFQAESCGLERPNQLPEHQASWLTGPPCRPLSVKSL